eukprot:788090-Rhodomonas_salina.1
MRHNRKPAAIEANRDFDSRMPQCDKTTEASPSNGKSSKTGRSIGRAKVVKNRSTGIARHRSTKSCTATSNWLAIRQSRITPVSVSVRGRLTSAGLGSGLGEAKILAN